VIRVAGNRTVRAESEQHVGAELTNVERQVADHFVKVLAVKLAVGIVQHDALRNFQDVAGGGKLLPPHGCQLLVAGGASTMAGSLPRREADHAGLDGTIAVKAQRATEAPGLVVGVGGDAHQAQHGVIVT
jgi:hypothetical protein